MLTHTLQSPGVSEAQPSAQAIGEGKEKGTWVVPRESQLSQVTMSFVFFLPNFLKEFYDTSCSLGKREGIGGAKISSTAVPVRKHV